MTDVSKFTITVTLLCGGMTDGSPMKVKALDFGPDPVEVAGVHGPVSLTVEYRMLVMMRGVFPWLMKMADWLIPPGSIPVIAPGKARTGGVTARRAATLCPVPRSVTGVLVLKPATPLTVVTRTSDESAPTIAGLKEAWKVNDP